MGTEVIRSAVNGAHLMEDEVRSVWNDLRRDTWMFKLGLRPNKPPLLHLRNPNFSGV